MKSEGKKKVNISNANVTKNNKKIKDGKIIKKSGMEKG